jgi:hypothetical protein
VSGMRLDGLNFLPRVMIGPRLNVLSFECRLMKKVDGLNPARLFPTLFWIGLARMTHARLPLSNVVKIRIFLLPEEIITQGVRSQKPCI